MIAYIHKIDFELIARGFLVDLTLPDPMVGDAMSYHRPEYKELGVGISKDAFAPPEMEEIIFYKAQFLVDGRIIMGWVKH